MKTKIVLLSITALFLYIFANAQSSQNVQDTFFNMKLGQTYSSQSIQNHVGQRGRYIDVTDSGSYKKVAFKDVSFGGNTWNFANFLINNSGQFFEFDLSRYFESRSDALSAYNSMVDRLGNKYNESESDSELNDKFVRYDGDNDISVLISFEYAQSKGGTHYYYVNLEYYNYNLYKALQDSLDSEL